MRGISAVSFALLAAGTAADALTCYKGLYMIVARGSEERTSLGVTSDITDMIVPKIDNSDVVAVDYPATIADPPYEISEAEGVESMQKVISEYYELCPDSKIAILGYSQGAQVAMDVLCGGSGGLFDAAKPIDANIFDNSIVAVALYGDPTFIANLTYDRGTGTHGGIFERNDTSACEKHASKIISYCDADDVYCDQGNNFSVHHQYVERYGSEIADWVVEQFDNTPPPRKTGLASASSSTPTAVVSAASGLAPATSSLVFGAAMMAAALTAGSWIL